MPEVTTRIAAISGGLGDIGQACATALASGGVDIAVSDLQPDHRVATLRKKIESAGSRFHFMAAEVSNGESVQRWFDAVEKDLGTVNIAVANAAIVEACTLEQMTGDVWQRHLDTNLSGVLNVANMAARRMVAAGCPGHIVLLGSWAAGTPHRRIPAYSVTKAGARMLCRLLALQYAANGILVNEVAPGYVDAGLSKRFFDEDPALRARITDSIPLRRLMSAEDVAWYVLQVCDPRNRNMTGATIVCDGGVSLVSAAEGA